MMNEFTTVISAGTVIVTVILSHVASASKRSKQNSAVLERLSNLEADMRWLKTIWKQNNERK